MPTKAKTEEISLGQVVCRLFAALPEQGLAQLDGSRFLRKLNDTFEGFTPYLMKELEKNNLKPNFTMRFDNIHGKSDILYSTIMGELGMTYEIMIPSQQMVITMTPLILEDKPGTPDMWKGLAKRFKEEYLKHG